MQAQVHTSRVLYVANIKAEEMATSSLVFQIHCSFPLSLKLYLHPNIHTIW